MKPKAIDDSHLKVREMCVEVYHKAAGLYKIPNFPVKFSETPGARVYDPKKTSNKVLNIGSNNTQVIFNSC